MSPLKELLFVFLVFIMQIFTVIGSLSIDEILQNGQFIKLSCSLTRKGEAEWTNLDKPLQTNANVFAFVETWDKNLNCKLRLI